MTLDDVGKVKKMQIIGTFSDADDLVSLWTKTYPLGNINLRGSMSGYSIDYKGEFYKALYVLGCVVEAVRNAKAKCRLEISCMYEQAS